MGRRRKSRHWREGQEQGSRRENLNVIEKKRGGNDLKDKNGDEKMVEGERASPARCTQAPFPPSRLRHSRTEEGRGLLAP
jgi:hypothetical protein